MITGEPVNRRQPGAAEPGIPSRPGAAGIGRERGIVLVLCAGGAALALLAAGRVWVRLVAARHPPLPDLAVGLTGREVEPLVAALGVVGLAGVVALLATRGRARLVVGGLLAAAGALLVVRSLPHLAAPAAERSRALLVGAGRASGVPATGPVAGTAGLVGPLLAGSGGLALLAGGLAAALRGRRWPGMSARYETPAGAATTTGRAAAPPAATPERPVQQRSAAMWDALDRGEDPTAAAPAHPSPAPADPAPATPPGPAPATPPG